MDEPWLEAVHAIVESAPTDHLDDYATRLAALADEWPGAVRLPTRTGAVDDALADLSEVLASLGACPRSPGDVG